MEMVSCSRCGRKAAGLERAPLPGEAGARVLAGTCAACWQEWKDEQVRQINEHGLSPVDPEHYRRLIETMDGFLGLRA